MEEAIFRIGIDEELPLGIWSYLVKRRANSKCQGDYHEVGHDDTEPGFSHHKLPTQLGGKSTLRNGEYLCVKCHSHVHSNLRQIYASVKHGWPNRALEAMRKQYSEKQCNVV